MPLPHETNADLIDSLYRKINECLPPGLQNPGELRAFVQSLVSKAAGEGILPSLHDAVPLNETKELPGLADVLHASNNAVLILDQAGKILFINKKAEQKLGWTRREGVDQYLSSKLKAADHKAENGDSIFGLYNAANNSNGYRVEYFNETGKERYYLLVNISEIHLKDAFRYVVSIRDISKEVEFESELKRQKKFTEDILNNLPADIAVFDKDHHYLFVNPWAIRDPDLRQWIIGKTDFEYFEFKGKVPEAADLRREYFRQSVETGTVVQWVDKITSASGQIKYILRNFYPYSENGRVKYVFGYGIDVTEMRQTEERLNETLQSLEAINSELEHIAYIISHDLQEPLRMVKSFVQLLEMKLSPVLDDTDRQYIGFAKAGTDRMKLHIQDLLEYSRIGKKREELQDTSIIDIINELKIVFQLSLSESDSEVICGDLPVISAYKEGLYHLFQNLIENAIKYRDPAKPKNIITIDHEQEVDGVIFSVRDNGLGIEKKFFEKIFQLFQRLDGDKTGSNGTGVGLAICKKIVEIHKRRIWIESEPGIGTVFFIKIPKNIN